MSHISLCLSVKYASDLIYRTAFNLSSCVSDVVWFTFCFIITWTTAGQSKLRGCTDRILAVRSKFEIDFDKNARSVV